MDRLPVIYGAKTATGAPEPIQEGERHQTLVSEAIAMVDAATGNFPAYFMVNCAHPDHLTPALDGGDWMARLRGVGANASRCSHAELDNRQVLDAGDPLELAAQLVALRRAYPQISVLGGCCGTDIRHMAAIAAAATG